MESEKKTPKSKETISKIYQNCKEHLQNEIQREKRF